jgi:hypothetical protein
MKNVIVLCLGILRIAKLSVIMLILSAMLNVIMLDEECLYAHYHYIECRIDKCLNAECNYAKYCYP